MLPCVTGGLHRAPTPDKQPGLASPSGQKHRVRPLSGASPTPCQALCWALGRRQGTMVVHKQGWRLTQPGSPPPSPAAEQLNGQGRRTQVPRPPPLVAVQVT